MTVRSHGNAAFGRGDGGAERVSSRKTRSAEWRRTQPRGLQRLLQEKEREIYKALDEDLGKHHTEAYRDEARKSRISPILPFFFFLICLNVNGVFNLISHAIDCFFTLFCRLGL